MRLENRTVIYNNLIDSKTGKPIRKELDPKVCLKDLKKGIKNIKKAAKEAGDCFKRMLQKSKAN